MRIIPYLDMLQPWQTAISACAALFVGFVGWINVSRQLRLNRRVARINLMSREEDRIERTLPGLREAFQFAFSIKGIVELFRVDSEAAHKWLKRIELAHPTDV